MSDDYDPIYDPEKNARGSKLPPYNGNFNPAFSHRYEISELRMMTSVQIREMHSERAQLLANAVEEVFGKPIIVTQSKGTGDILEYKNFRLYYSETFKQWIADFPCGLVFTREIGIDPLILSKKVQKWSKSCAAWDRKLTRRAEAFEKRVRHRWPSDRWEFERGKVHRNGEWVPSATVSDPFKFDGQELVITAAIATLYLPSRTTAELTFDGAYWEGELRRGEYDSHTYKGPLKAIVRNMVKTIEDTRRAWVELSLPGVK